MGVYHGDPKHTSKDKCRLKLTGRWLLHYDYSIFMVEARTPKENTITFAYGGHISFPSECLGWQTFFAGSNLYLFRIILDSECNVLWSSQLARDYWTLTARIAPVKNPVQISVAVEVEEVPRDENYINLVARTALSIRWVVFREGVRSTMNGFRWRSYSNFIMEMNSSSLNYRSRYE